jgi:hypothetical protein
MEISDEWEAGKAYLTFKNCESRTRKSIIAQATCCTVSNAIQTVRHSQLVRSNSRLHPAL